MEMNPATSSDSEFQNPSIATAPGFPFRLMIALAVLWMLPSPSASGATGHLVIIGGGARPPAVMARMVALAGGSSGRIVVVPTASAEPEEVGTSQAAEFQASGADTAFVLIPTLENANSDSMVAAVAGATGVFFSGGDQRRLTTVLLGTRLLDEIKALYARGGMIGGTSAGAAVMSAVMITGDERAVREPGDEFSTIEAGNIITSEGFGLVADAIMDQHFVARKRHNRLMSLVIERPELVGIGIDEATAVVVTPDGVLDVIGESCVIVYDATTAARTRVEPDGDLEAVGVTVHVLLAGSSYDLNARKVVR
jgi:cyanophycinase